MIRVHITQSDFGRGFEIYLIRKMQDGIEFIGRVNEHGQILFDVPIEEGTRLRQPTIEILRYFDGADGFELMREFALAFVRAGFIATDPRDKHEELYKNHIESLKHAATDVSKMAHRHLDVIEKLLVKPDPTTALVVPQGTEFRKV